MFFRLISNSEKGKIRKKNHFANFLEFFGEAAFDFIEWAELALPIQLIVNSNRII